MKSGMHEKVTFPGVGAIALCFFLLSAAAQAEQAQGGDSATAALAKADSAQIKSLTGLWEQGGGQVAALHARARAAYGVTALDELSKEQTASLLDTLRKDIQAKAVPFSPVTNVSVMESPAQCVSLLYYGPDFYREVVPGLVGQLASRQKDEVLPRLKLWYALAPDDPEVHYGLALAYSVAGDTDAAVRHAKEAVGLGLPLGRFLAGPRDLLSRLHKTNAFQAMVKREKCALVHGPSVGAFTHQSARFWVRTAEEAEVTVTVQAVEAAAGAREVKGKTTKQGDWTTVLEVAGLTADTPYQYSVTVDGRPVAQDVECTFRTFPEPGKAGVFRVGFGSQSGYSPAQEGVWDGIRQRKLNALLLLGGNLSLSRQSKDDATQRYGWYRRQSSPTFRRFAASTPVFAIWDDNDIGPVPAANSREPGTLAGTVELFRQNQVSPAPDGAGATGIWFSFALGNVTFFMLDCVSQRSAAEGGPPTMLGPAQKQWLLDGLKSSKAVFKVIASPAPWAPSSAWSQVGRTWDAFAEEREEIFSFIENQKVEGVVLISGGTMPSTDMRRIPRSKGYDLFDLHSSRLTDVTQVTTAGGAILNYDEGYSYGVLEFDTGRETPRLTAWTIDAAGQEVRNHDLVLHAHDLDFEGLPDQDGIAVDLAFTKRPLIYDDGSLAEQGMLKVRIENTSDQVQEGILHLYSVPGSIVRFPETPQYMLDPGQVIERVMPIELVRAQVHDLIRVYAREGRDALRVGKKMRAPRGKSKGDDSLAAVMQLVDFRFKQTPGATLLDKEDPNPQPAENGRIWFAMVDDRLVLRVVAFDAAPSQCSGRWTWNLWESSCLEVFGVNRGQKGMLGENIAQIFLIPGVKAIPDTSIIGKPMAYRLWRDWFRTKFASGYEGEPLPEVKVRSEFTKDGWILEAMVPLKLPVYNPDQPGVAASISSKRKLIHLYADQLRIEFQLSTRLTPDEPFTHHGVMVDSKHASQDTEKYAYVEWIDVAEWDKQDEDKKSEDKKSTDSENKAADKPE